MKKRMLEPEQERRSRREQISRMFYALKRERERFADMMWKYNMMKGHHYSLESKKNNREIRSAIESKIRMYKSQIRALQRQLSEFDTHNVLKNKMSYYGR